VHDDDDDHEGGFIVEGHEEEVAKPRIGQAYATTQSLASNGKPRPHQVSTEEVPDEESEVEQTPASKRRVNPPKPPAARTKPKTPAKRPAAQKNIPASRLTRKRQVPVPVSGSEGEEDAHQTSSVSDLTSEEDASSSASAVPQKKAEAPIPRATLPARTAARSPRKTPRREAARRSETAVRSHYFERSDEAEGDGDE